MKEKKSWWTPLVNFLIHAVIGTLIFLIISIPAVALSVLVHWLESVSVPAFTIKVLTFLEQTILLVDATAVLIYVIFSTYREVSAMIRDFEEVEQ